MYDGKVSWSLQCSIINRQAMQYCMENEKKFNKNTRIGSGPVQ